MGVCISLVESGELLIVVRVGGGWWRQLYRPGASAIQDYGRRWQIERLFACLKSRGFDFESTHITEPERLTKMIFLLTFRTYTKYENIHHL